MAKKFNFGIFALIAALFIILVLTNVSTAGPIIPEDLSFAKIGMKGLSFASPQIATVVNTAICLSAGPIVCAEQIVEGKIVGTIFGEVYKGAYSAISQTLGAETAKAVAEGFSTYNEVKGWINDGAEIIEDLKIDRTGKVNEGKILFSSNKSEIGGFFDLNASTISVSNAVFTRKETPWLNESFLIFEEKGYLKLKDPKTGKELIYTDMKKGSKISFNEKGEIVEANIISNKDGATYTFGTNKQVMVQNNTEISYFCYPQEKKTIGGITGKIISIAWGITGMGPVEVEEDVRLKKIREGYCALTIKGKEIIYGEGPDSKKISILDDSIEISGNKISGKKFGFKCQNGACDLKIEKICYRKTLQYVKGVATIGKEAVTTITGKIISIAWGITGMGPVEVEVMPFCEDGVVYLEKDGYLIDKGIADNNKIRINVLDSKDNVLLANANTDVSAYKGNWIKISEDKTEAKSSENSKIDALIKNSTAFNVRNNEYLHLEIQNGDGMSAQKGIVNINHEKNSGGKTRIKDGDIDLVFEKDKYTKSYEFYYVPRAEKGFKDAHIEINSDGMKEKVLINEGSAASVNSNGKITTLYTPSSAPNFYDIKDGGKVYYYLRTEDYKNTNEIKTLMREAWQYYIDNKLAPNIKGLNPELQKVVGDLGGELDYVLYSIDKDGNKHGHILFEGFEDNKEKAERSAGLMINAMFGTAKQKKEICYIRSTSVDIMSQQTGKKKSSTSTLVHVSMESPCPFAEK
jgi:hypothetical protein